MSFLSAIWVPDHRRLAVLGDRFAPQPPLGGCCRWIGAVVGLLVTIPLYTGFDNHGGDAVRRTGAWIPRFNINYHLGVDGISMLFVILNSFITVIVVLAGWQVIEQKVPSTTGLS